jgi:Spy/CpxP family protein refolding chaperone
MKKYTCFALLAFFGAAALTPVMAIAGATENTKAPAAPHDDAEDHDNDHNKKEHKGK